MKLRPIAHGETKGVHSDHHFPMFGNKTGYQGLSAYQLLKNVFSFNLLDEGLVGVIASKRLSMSKTVAAGLA